jgi:hypothetical protein
VEEMRIGGTVGLGAVFILDHTMIEVGGTG